MTWNNSEFFGLRKQIILKKLDLSPNFVDFKQIIPAGDCFNEEWFFVTNNEQISQWVTSDLLQRATSATNNEWISQRVARHFLQRAISATSNEQFFAMSNFCNE